MRRLLHSAAALCLGLSLAFGTPASAQNAWDLSMEDRANSLPGEGATFFADKVRALTNGQIEITVHHGGALGFKNVDHLDAVATGALPLAQSLAGTFGGTEPIFLLSSLPFIVNDIDGAQALYRAARPAYESALERHNQRLLYATAFPPSGIWAKQTIQTQADLQGLKIRTYDVNGTTTFRDAGAAPLQVSFSDIIPQLSTGNINAVLTSADGGRSMSFWEYLSHFNAVGYAFPLNITTVNLDAWNDLSEEQREAVSQAAEQTEVRDWQAVTEWTERNYAALREHDVEIVDSFSDELLDTLADAGQPAIDDWLSKTGEEGRAILDGFESGSN